MQLEESNRLRKQWGDAPCDHPNIEKEYLKSMSTGDEVCTTCGRAIYDMNGNRIEPQKKK